MYEENAWLHVAMAMFLNYRVSLPMLNTAVHNSRVIYANQHRVFRVCFVTKLYSGFYLSVCVK